MPPESGEAEPFPRSALLKNQGASIAVASVAFWEGARTFLEAQTSLFSLINSLSDGYSLYTVISSFYYF